MQALADRLSALSAEVAALPDWQAFLAVLGLAVLAAAAIHVLGDIVLKRLTTRIPGEVDDIILLNAHTAIWASVGLAGLYLATEQVSSVPESWLTTTNGVTLSAIVLIWAWTAVRTTPEVLDEVTEASYIDQQVVPIFQNIFTAVVVALSLFLVLSIWQVNVTPLLASAGVLGIVVGLAARDAIANFFGSLALYADGTYTIGDFIVLESGKRGRVEDISIRSTVIRTRDDILVTIPNAKLNNAAIVNESDPQRYRRITVSVGVAYGTEIDRVEDILLSVADEADTVRANPQPRVFVTEFGDSSVSLDLLCWIDNPRLRERVQDELMRDIYDSFRAEDIEIPYPQRDVTVEVPGAGETPDIPLDSDSSKGNYAVRPSSPS
jgi:small-conductance mechanosensitive channel